MFNYKTLADLTNKCDELNVKLPFSDDTSVLKESIKIENKVIHNRLVVQPMEGCDGKADGSLDELPIRRYDRFAKGGAGLVWFEAVAIMEEARANPRQLWINDNNLDSFKKVVEDIKSACFKENGFEPVVIMQATHSGRYSKPYGKPAPLIAYNNPILEKDGPLSADRIVSDDYIKQVEEAMGKAVKLSKEVGFDGVDVKSCHRYLGSELLSAYNRSGEYGGSFENRTRFLTNCVKNANTYASPDFLVTSRLNIYDGYPYPYGFGVKDGGDLTPDLTEGKKLIGILHKELGMKLIDITIGNPYNNPHVNRPADFQPYPLSEDPLVGVERIINCAKEIQNEYKDLVVIGSGLTYLRGFSDQMVAGAIKEGYFSLAGFGRMAFAYPDFAKDIVNGNGLDPKQVCISCGRCSLLMRYGSTAGCVIRDKYYTDLFKVVSEGQTPIV